MHGLLKTRKRYVVQTTMYNAEADELLDLHC